MDKLNNQDHLKNIVKTALIEVLEERQDLLHNAIESVLEDVALCRAIKEGETTDLISREEVFKVLKG